MQLYPHKPDVVLLKLVILLSFFSKCDNLYLAWYLLFEKFTHGSLDGKAIWQWPLFSFMLSCKIFMNFRSSWDMLASDFLCVGPPNRHATSPEGPLKVLTSRTSRRPSGNSWRTNKKIADLMKKVFFRCNSLSFTHLLLFFTGKTNMQKF